MAREIQPVANNRDKQHTYQEQLGRYNIAMKHGFYLEALMIDYAIIEDRMKALLYHAGMLNSRDTYKKVDNKVVRRALALLPEMQGKNGKLGSLGITTLSGKMSIIQSTLTWAMTTDGVPENNVYLKTLKNQYEGAFDISDVLRTLHEIEAWKEYRNEIIHALMNKNTDSVNAHLCERTEHGMKLARQMDSYVKQLKKGNVIRKSMKLGTK